MVDDPDQKLDYARLKLVPGFWIEFATIKDMISYRSVGWYIGVAIYLAARYPRRQNAQTI